MHNVLFCFEKHLYRSQKALLHGKIMTKIRDAFFEKYFNHFLCCNGNTSKKYCNNLNIAN